MKVAVLLAYTCAVLTRTITCGAAIKAPLDIISLDDISESDRKELEFLDSQYLYPRPKRSHNDDLISSLKASIGQGIKSKLGLIAKGSASTVSHISKGSSGGGYHGYDHHHYHEPYDHKPDFWSLKKAILNTLLQAVKAIKGGVIAVKGQLIKGSGYLLSAKGKLITAKGEAITTLGKNIATAAVSKNLHHHDHHHHEEYGSPHEFPHSAPESYGSHSAPGPEFEAPDHHYHQYHHSPHHEDKPEAPDHAGLLIIKKIPKHHGSGHHTSGDDHHSIPDFKPIAPSGPSWGTIVGKLFSASTSLKPGEPAPFGHTAPEHTYHHTSNEEEDYHDYHHHHDHEPPHHGRHPDHEPPHHDDHNDHESPHHDHHSLPHHDDDSHPHHDDHHLPHTDQSDFHHKPHSTNYGTPFEKAPSFLNIESYASESKTKSNQAKPESGISENKPEAQKLQVTTPITYDEIRPLSTAFSNIGFDQTLAITEKPKLYFGSVSDKPNTSFPPYLPTALPSHNPIEAASPTPTFGFQTGLKYQNQALYPTSLNLYDQASFGTSFQNTGGSFDNLKNLAANHNGQGPQVFPSTLGLSGYRTQSKPSPSSAHLNYFLDSLPSPTQYSPHNYKRPTRSKTTNRHKKPHYYRGIRPITHHQIGPNGPKKL